MGRAAFREKMLLHQEAKGKRGEKRIPYYSEKYDVILFIIAGFASPAFRLVHFFAKGEWTIQRE